MDIKASAMLSCPTDNTLGSDQALRLAQFGVTGVRKIRRTWQNSRDHSQNQLNGGETIENLKKLD